jgi:hypothetical protein
MKQVERYAREIVPAFNAYFYFRIAHRASDATVVLVINHRSNMDYGRLLREFHCTPPEDWTGG